MLNQILQFDPSLEKRFFFLEMDQTVKFSQNLTENSVNIRQFSWFKKVRKVRRTLKPNLEPPEPPFWPQKPNLEPTEPEKTERTSEPNQVRSKSSHLLADPPPPK